VSKSNNFSIQSYTILGNNRWHILASPKQLAYKRCVLVTTINLPNIPFNQEKCLTFELPPTLMHCQWTAADVCQILQNVKEGSDYCYFF